RNFILITSMYVVLIFDFVVCYTQVLLSVDYSTHQFISMLILFVLLPTFFLLGYIIILSIHCFIDSFLARDKIFVEEAP
ncbi:glycosyltransferase family 2 protein, partial [Francisella tularensis subsp. holarctica]|nr:glycosyltransferase family 2 protein [Francisella tularensis subsp. holarctica]